MESIDDARALLRRALEIIERCDVTTGICCCGDDMRGHEDPMTCGHVATDEGGYYADSLRTDIMNFLGESK